MERNDAVQTHSKGFKQKLLIKCEGLLELVCGVQKFYQKANPDACSFIETTIGAAIWYLPKDHDLLFTGYISVEAVTKNERSEDHLYPRKIAAKYLLDYDWSNESEPLNHLIDRYLKRFGRYNYVSKTENKKLVKFQRHGVFTTPEDAYEKAGIKLIPMKASE